MSANLQTLQRKTYFIWAERLWYIVDVSHDGEMAFVEDCSTYEVKWMPTKHFRDRMKEVKMDGVGNR